MPIQNSDLGKFKRPGIFINEIDQSIIELPVQDVLINLVPGFSKKGPVNRPVYVTNPVDFTTIFGDIDKQLERKGSYFHRTAIKMLENGPIWALNLLSTNDARDKANWKSISLGSYYDNNVTKTMPYSRLFNRQDFWTRDDESFLDYVNDPTEDTDRLLHLTNLGDKTNTTFMFKSSITGFDVTAEDWYGGASKVPSYINAKDWISDYMVTVLVLEGDWTDYNSLAVSTSWSSYFTTSGLLKTQVQNFVNEPNVTVLANYDVSLIPYFKDLNGRSMYIKSVINNYTDSTGLFSAFNEDYLLSSDYPTGKVDIIGDGLVDVEKDYINFLSYDETISENLTYAQKSLDSANNVFGNFSYDLTNTYVPGTTTRTAEYTNGFISNAKIGATGQTFVEVLDFNNSEMSLSTTPPYYSWLHSDLNVNDVVYFNKNHGPLSANTAYYIVEKTGTIFKISASIGGSQIIFSTAEQTVAAGLYVQRVTVGMTYSGIGTFVLDGVQYTFDTGTTKVVFDPLDIPLNTAKANRYDVIYLSKGDNAEVNILKGTQSYTTLTATKPQFTSSLDDNIILGYVHLTYNSASTTNYTGSTISVDYTPVSLDQTNGYVLYTDIYCSGATIGAINYLDLFFIGTSGGTDYTNYRNLRYRHTYTELSTKLAEGKATLINYVTGDKLAIPTVTNYDYSTVTDGKIRIKLNSEDYNKYHLTGNTYGFLAYYIDDEFVINNTLLTNRIYTSAHDISLLTNSGQSSLAAGVIGKYSNLYTDYYDGVINNWDYIFVDGDTGGTSGKIYMKMWFEGTDLYVDLMDSDKISPSPSLVNWLSLYNQEAIVHSAESTFKQTIEIEDFDTTKYPNQVTSIKVDKLRYSELIRGNFVEAYYNAADYAIGGDLYGTDPKKLCRIVSTTIDSTNSDWKVITTDSPIMLTSFSKIGNSAQTDYQTTTYPQVDTYVDTYKGIKLLPFTIHVDSMPNGTETRQSSILDVMAKTTNLGKGLINKNKISWRYLVDSFGLGLTANSKQQYADLCGAKLNCLGFINMPSVRTLKKSTNPYFINTDYTLNTAYLKAGGDESKSPSFLYSFCNGVGRSTVGYFFPYVTIDDDGTPKDVPPAAFCASTYMAKFNTSQGGVYPWTIAAGITYGRVTNIAATEMDFTDEDLENLNQMGANSIVKKGNNGYCIDTENTAQVFPYSSLSLLHSREVLIELENRMYDMLLRYQWRFNTPEIRSEIKFRADKICDNLKNSNALYDYRNVMDETNNTNFIIDLQMGVIDTYIEIIKGLSIIVNNITILKKGDIESGGFK